MHDCGWQALANALNNGAAPELILLDLRENPVDGALPCLVLPLRPPPPLPLLPAIMCSNVTRMCDLWSQQHLGKHTIW